ncbi:DUF262 domain-containing protein [Mucilaginibacter robiniae]|uniref:DUF262 domain-containing protein n=1 Tax=Mucilaginibacter robiniae TaxID=2728022 RepID=A0A7L5E203_9SPHI|nr:DUF262 domain-containing protein [Mucilaginibacter robiniae]QJD94366.1 DUF262 domain-containing protein [Mucilaginibacter robiniae]
MYQYELFTIIDETEKEHIDFRYEITSYGADYPVDSLVQRISSKVIFVPPFQRKFVWDIFEASKFVESLILGLPVPGIFLSKEKETNRLLIVDGQQRLLTLHSYYTGKFKDQEFRLLGVQKDLEGKRYHDLSLSDKTRLDDSILHSTIIRQDEPDDNESSIYLIFERLNSGGRPLSPQEIRACIYYGKYNELLGKLTKNVHWRMIFGPKHNDRLKEEELVLRFFSLYYDIELYQKPLKDFLNRRMSANRNFELYSQELLEETFNRTITFIDTNLGKSAFKVEKGVHTAIFDSILIGVGKRLERGPILDTLKFKDTYRTLLNDKSYKKLIDTGTSDENSLKKRIELATGKFSKLA